MSHYDTLDVPNDADEATIKRAYRRKSSEHHPDRGGDTTQMAAINRAYETLSDPTKRKRYDATGEDQPHPSEEQRAMELVMQVIARMIDQRPESDDLIAAARAEFKSTQSQFKSQQAVWRSQLRDLEKRRKRLKYKAKTRNFLDDLLAQRIEQYTAQIKDMDENSVLCDKAIELLKDYEYEATPPVATKSQNPYTAFGSLGQSQWMFGQGQ